ncbi:hypothetical protein [Alteromonas facilis]|uniref:hypothetical protein n=1 Tax=Alteromonas facilis TaxID=2048004 RepID=UPI000C2870D5|nr:hypothetical protein [Alteromonas facilis]
MKILSCAFVLVVLMLFSGVSKAVPIELGRAGDFTLLSAGISGWDAKNSVMRDEGRMILGSQAQIFGNIGARTSIVADASVNIHGDLVFGTANVSSANVFGNIVGLSEPQWNEIFTDLTSASLAASAMRDNASAVNYGSILSSTIFNTSSNFNVININGDLELMNGESLTIRGSATDQFVINVSGNFGLCRHTYVNCDASILLDGVLAENVIFNFESKIGNASINGNNAGSMAGNYISSAGFSWLLGDGMVLEDVRILASNIPTANVQDVKQITPTVSVYEPKTVALMFIALLSLRLIRRGHQNKAR